MRRVRRLAVAIGLGLAAALAIPAPPASAHPLGNFTVNAYSGITVTPGLVRVDYVLDLAEIPTFQELGRIDANGDDLIVSEERSAWASMRAEQILSALSVHVNGQPVSLISEGSVAELSAGQGGLQILRLESSFAAAVPPEGRLRFRDGSVPDRIGWREITAIGAEGVAVTASSVPATSVSRELFAYPQDLLSSPPQVREASFSFEPGETRPAPGPPAGGAASRPGDQGGTLVGLVAAPSLSVGAVLLSLLVAFGVGALHAMAPGHGKTITAAYLAGSSGLVRHAIGAGAAVSAMHTVSVVVLGLLVVAAERAFPAERVYPWLGLVAGGAALALGSGLLLTRLAHRRHGHEDERGRTHRPLSRRGLAALAMSGGILPSPTALVVLLAAVSLGRVAFGIGLIVAFALGLAVALATIGVVAVRARDVVTRRSWHRVTAALPIVSAAAILAVGVVLTARAVGQL
jgi:ABC-type nickel/cobalt efflux system permease component RcnA